MNRLHHASAARLAVLSLLSAGLLVGCQSKPAQPAAASSAAPIAPPVPANLPKLVAPLQGEVTLDYTAPETKREKDLVVTTVHVKNVNNGAIAGLKINEYWWDRAGNPVSGGETRLDKLLMPGETATLSISTAYSPKLDRNKLTFSHANGTIKPVLVKELPPDTTKTDTSKTGSK